MKRITILLTLLAVVAMGSQAVCQKTPTSYDLLKATLPEATKMLDANPGLATDSDGGSGSALILAIDGDRADLVKLLLSRRADPNLRDEFNRTALHWAAGKGNLAIIRLLLDHKANINAVDDCGLTPLCLAALVGQPSAAKFLISSGAKVNIFEATALKDKAQVERMLKSDPKLAKATTKTTITPLFIAAKVNDLALVKLFISKGADVKAKADIRDLGFDSQEGDITPLHDAVGNGNMDMVKLLIEKGADINAEHSGLEYGGVTPLHITVATNDVKMAQYLISKGAKVNAKMVGEAEGMTPLFEAVDGNHVSMAKLLLSKGASVNIRYDGDTVLSWAKKKGNKQMIALLKKYGAKL